MIFFREETELFKDARRGKIDAYQSYTEKLCNRNQWKGSYGNPEDSTLVEFDDFRIEGMIRKIGIKTRFLDDPIIEIVQGIQITLNDGTERAFGMELNDRQSVAELEVPEGQLIKSVIVKSGWFIDSLELVTNTGFRLKGGEGGGGDAHEVTGGHDGVLTGISGKVVYLQGAPAICRLHFKFFNQ